MGKTYLVAVDGSKQSWKAVDLAAELAGQTGAKIALIHVVPVEPAPPGIERWAEIEGLTVAEVKARRRHALSIGDAVVKQGEKRIREAGLSDISTRTVEGDTAGQIVALAEDIKADIVFVGTRGMSDLSGALLGSISHKVAQLAPCPCALVR